MTVIQFKHEFLVARPQTGKQSRFKRRKMFQMNRLLGGCLALVELKFAFVRRRIRKNR